MAHRSDESPEAKAANPAQKRAILVTGAQGLAEELRERKAA